MSKWVKAAYTREEADREGVRYKDWRDPEADGGDYVVSDDDVVVKVKRAYYLRNSPNNKAFRRVCWTVLGGFAQDRLKPLYLKDRLREYDKRGFVGEERQTRRFKELTNPQKNWAKMVLNGADPILAAQAVWPEKSIPALKLRIKNITSSRAFTKFIGEEMTNELEKAGITKSYIALKLKELIEHGRDTTRLKAIELALNYYKEKADVASEEHYEFEEPAWMTNEAGPV